MSKESPGRNFGGSWPVFAPRRTGAAAPAAPWQRSASSELLAHWCDDVDQLWLLCTFLTPRCVLALSVVNRAWKRRRITLIRQLKTWILVRTSRDEQAIWSIDRDVLLGMGTVAHPRRYPSVPPSWNPPGIELLLLESKMSLVFVPRKNLAKAGRDTSESVHLELRLVVQWRQMACTVGHKLTLRVRFSVNRQRLIISPFQRPYAWQLVRTLHTNMNINYDFETIARPWLVSIREEVAFDTLCNSHNPNDTVWYADTRSTQKAQVIAKLGTVGSTLAGANPTHPQTRGKRPVRLYLSVAVKIPGRRVPTLEPLLLPDDLTDVLLDMCRGVKRRST
jgi:hypothetical protein